MSSGCHSGLPWMPIVCMLMHGSTIILNNIFISEAPSPSSPFSMNLLSGKLILETLQLREWELNKMLCLFLNKLVKYS